jgi:hypothetical protein
LEPVVAKADWLLFVPLTILDYITSTRFSQSGYCVTKSDGHNCRIRGKTY